MKLLKSVCTVVAAASFACAAQAATYSVNGVMTGVDVAFPAGPLVMDSYIISFNPTNPAFSGSWNIDLSTPSLSGVADFESYQAITNFHLSLIDTGTQQVIYSADGGTTLTRPHDIQTIDGSNALYTYDPLTRTLTVNNPVITLSGISTDCVATGAATCAPGDYIPDTQNEIIFQLVFGEDLQSFTGTSSIKRTFTDGTYDNTHWSFSGTAVPVPAAAWLLGSGLIGLAGVARRRKQ